MHLLNVSLNNLLQHVHNCKNSLQAAVLHCQGPLRQEDNATGEHHVLYKGLWLQPNMDHVSGILQLSLALLPCTSLLCILLSQPYMFAATVLQAGRWSAIIH